jgi:hypothetical protein
VRAPVLAVLLLLALAPAAHARAGWRDCDAMIVDQGRVEVYPSIYIVNGAPERRGFPKASTAFFIQIRGGGCATARNLVRAVLAAPDESATLLRSGFRLVSAEDFVRLSKSGPTYRVLARRGSKRVRYVRFGENPRVDSTFYRAGQHLEFYLTDLECTAGYVLQLPSGRAGSTAGHCSNYPAFGGVENEGPFRVDAPSEPGFGLNLDNPFHRGGPDALVFDLRDVPAIQQIERGGEAPLAVTGTVTTERQRKGLRVCFAGRTSGADGNCGRIFRFQEIDGQRVICARTRARGGDSGGPVFLPPLGGRTQAVGIVKGDRLNLPPLTHGELCYTAIDDVLAAFGATFPRGRV